MTLRPTRRQLLVWASSVSIGRFVPACGDEPAASANPFLSDDERRALASLANAVLPPEGGPGGGDLGAARYIERLCTAFEVPVPTIYAGGPFSGRTPFATNDGKPGPTSPPNEFANFLPLDRVMERAWRLKLYGSDGVPGGAPNDALQGPVVGIRTRIKDGLVAAMHGVAPRRVEELSQPELEALFKEASDDFRDLLIELVTEAAFSAPEYGGNQDLGGWKRARYEGDRLPLGYSIYDETASTYVELPELPVSGPGSSDPAPMDEATLDLARAVVAFLGGQEVKK